MSEYSTNFLPFPIALLVYEYENEKEPYIKLHRMVDFFEIITRFMVTIVLSDIIRQNGKFSDTLKKNLTYNIERPTFGIWKQLLSLSLEDLPKLKDKKQQQCFITELPDFIKNTLLKLLGEKNTGDKKNEIIALRNYMAHSARINNSEYEELHNLYSERFKNFIADLSFFSKYNFVASSKDNKLSLLHGKPENNTFLEYKPTAKIEISPETVFFINQENEILDVMPLYSFEEIIKTNQTLHSSQIYFRFGENGLEFISFYQDVSFSKPEGRTLEKFKSYFPFDEWRKEINKEKEGDKKGLKNRFGFITLINELNKLFVGRDTELRESLRVIEENNEGMFWISGSPGIGKSALMAMIYTQLSEQDKNLVLVPYFFKIGNTGCSSSDFINFSISLLKPEIEEELKVQNQEDNKSTFVKMINSVSKSKKIIFLLDGIDEINRADSSFLDMPVFEIKENVICVLAGRNEAETEKKLEKTKPVFPEGISGLDENAVRSMLINETGFLRYRLFKRDEFKDDKYKNRFIEVMLKKSEGLPLYVKLVIEDIRNNKWSLDDEDKLPDGLASYYDLILENLKVSDIGTVLSPLLTLLVWAKEPVTKEGLKKLLEDHYLANLESWNELFEKTMSHGNMMMKQSVTPYGEYGWTIGYDSFSGHLQKSVTVKSNREWSKCRWLEVCSKWKTIHSESIKNYALRNYADHLFESKKWDELYALARNVDFVNSQKLYLLNQPELILKPSQLAVRTAINNDDPARMAEFLIIHANKLLEIKQESPLDALRGGNLERALEIANFYETEKMIIWHLMIAIELKNQDKFTDAQYVITQLMKKNIIEKVSRSWNNHQEIDIYPYLLKDLISIIKVEDIIKLLSFNDKDLFHSFLESSETIEIMRTKLFTRIAEEFVILGKNDNALFILEKTLFYINQINIDLNGYDLSKEKIELLIEISKLLAKIDNSEKLNQIINIIFQNNYFNGDNLSKEKIELLIEIAKLLAKIDNFEKLNQIINIIPQLDNKVEALVSISEYFESDDTEKYLSCFWRAYENMNFIDHEFDKSYFLYLIANGYSGIEKNDEALVTLEKAIESANNIKDYLEKAMALTMISITYLNLNKIDKVAILLEKALTLVNLIEVKKNKSDVLIQIAVVYLDSKNSEKVSNILEQLIVILYDLPENEQKVKTLKKIALMYVKLGKESKVIEITELIKDHKNKVEILKDIAIEYIKLKNKDEAIIILEKSLETAHFIKDNYKKSMVINEISIELFRLGKIEKALTSVNLIQGDTKLYALANISKEFLKLNKLDEALKTLNLIKNWYYEIQVFEELAVWYSKINKTEKDSIIREKIFNAVKTVINQEHDQINISITLVNISNYFAKAGETEIALEITNLILDNTGRSNAFQNIAEKYAESGNMAKAIEVINLMVKEDHFSEYKEFEIALNLAKKCKTNEVIIILEKIICSKNSFKKSSKVNTLMEIAIQYEKAGEIEKTIYILEKAVESIKIIPDGAYKSKNFTEILEIFLRLGKIDETLKFLNLILNKSEKYSILIKISKKYEELGQINNSLKILEKAVESANFIEDPQEKSWALTDISVKYARLGKPKKVFEVSNFIENSTAKFWYFMKIADTYLKYKKINEVYKIIDKSLKLVNQVPISEKNNLLSNIASIYACVGNIDKALKTVNLMEENSDNLVTKDETLSQIVSISSTKIDTYLKLNEIIKDFFGKVKKIGKNTLEKTKNTKNLDKVIKIVNLIKDEEIKSLSLQSIVFKHVESGNINEALFSANLIQDKYIKQDTLPSIIRYFSEIGKTEEALKTATMIEDKFNKSFELKNIAVEASKSGNTIGAIKILDQAFETSNLISNNKFDNKSVPLKEILIEYLNLGQIDKVLKNIDFIEDIIEKSELMKELAIYYAKLGNTNEVLKAFELINEESLKSEAIKVILFESSKLFKKEEVILLIDKFKSISNLFVDKYVKLYSLKEISINYLKQNEINDALLIAECIQDESIKSETFKGIVKICLTNKLPFPEKLISSLSFMLSNEECYKDFREILKLASENGDKKLFKDLLLLLPTDLDTCYKISSELLTLYPEQFSEIEKVILAG